jgi:hypothetical protein
MHNSKSPSPWLHRQAGICIDALSILIINYSMKPKGIGATQNQYTDSNITTLQSINTTSFQPSTNYSLLGPGCENHSKAERSPNTVVDGQEGIYEVLDGDENGPTTKGSASSKDERRMLLSEEQSGLYNKLKFEDDS